METTEKCSCKKYNKTTDEIVEACSKHRQAALMLKELGEKQKKKIDIFKLEIEQLKGAVPRFFDSTISDCDNSRVSSRC